MIEHQLSLSRSLMMNLRMRELFITFEILINWNIDWIKMKTSWSKHEWTFMIKASSSWINTIRKWWNLTNSLRSIMIDWMSWTTQNSSFVSWKLSFEKEMLKTIFEIRIHHYLLLREKCSSSRSRNYLIHQYSLMIKIHS